MSLCICNVGIVHEQQWQAWCVKGVIDTHALKLQQVNIQTQS